MTSIRTSLTVLAASLICAMAAVPASAATIGFEGLVGNNTQTTLSSLGVANTYQGNIWSAVNGSWGICDTNCFGDQPLRAHTGSAYAWSASGPQSMNIQFGTATTFTGGYFAGQFDNRGNYDSRTIQLSGYDANNKLVGSTGAVAMQDSRWGFIAANFSNISKLEIRSDRGGSWFAIDDLQFGATSVPEPTSLALLGLGLFGVAAARRKAAKKA